MTPLAPWTYGLRNAPRLVPQLAVAALVVGAVVVLLSLLRGFYATSMVYIREYRHYSVFQARSGALLTPALERTVAQQPSVERVLRVRNVPFPVQTPVGPWKTASNAVHAKDLPYLVRRLGDRLLAGRLPRPATNEVLVHEHFARINGWTVGTVFGRAVDPERYPAPAGRFVVVGLLTGPTPAVYFSYEHVANPLRYPRGLLESDRLLVVARPGRLAEMNAYLHRHPARAWIADHGWMKGVADRVFGPFLLGLRVLALLLMAVSLLVVGLLAHLDLRRRVDELAVLLSLGHAPRALLRRGGLESSGLLLSAWLLGVSLSQLVLYLLHALVMAPRGFRLPLLQGEPMLLSLVLPVTGVLVGLLLTHRRLRRMDPIRVLERRR